MYKLKLATTEEEILEFEQKRTRAFEPGKEIQSLKQATYANGIEKGDLLAFLCMKEKKPIGGMLLIPNKRIIEIHRLFVDEEERGQGAGSFMLDYVCNHQDFFEDYYGADFEGIVLEPLESSIDYYFDRGFDYSGFQMYKRYERSGK